MLNPPGRGSGGARRNPTRRKTAESPEDQLRALQRTGSNKKCADCTTKLPQCVNLTVRTFVCMACSGIHRELNMRVKGIGASTFSQEEVDRMKNTSNEAVNKMFLARYSSTERLRAPTHNHDQQLLRTWIRRKYHDKAWYSESPEPQPTRVEIPAKPVAPPADLLGFSPAPAAAPVQQQPQSWDAFGGSSQQQTNQFPADFGSSQTKQQQQQPQQQNFANFGQAQQPPAQQQHGNFANFRQMQQPGSSNSPQQQQAQNNFANFGQTQPPQQHYQSNDFANFGSQPPQQYLSQQQPPQQQPPQQQYQSNDFTNFGSKQTQQQSSQKQPPQQQQNVATFGSPIQGQSNVSVPQQQVRDATHQQPPQQQGQFSDFDQKSIPQQQIEKASLAPQPQAAAPQQQGNFGQFDQQKNPQTQQPQMVNFNQQQQGNFGMFDQQQSQPQAQQEQPQMGSFNQQQGNYGHPGYEPQQQPQASQQQPQAGSYNQQQQHGNYGQPSPQQQQPQGSQEQPPAINFNNQQQSQGQVAAPQTHLGQAAFGSLSQQQNNPTPQQEQSGMPQQNLSAENKGNNQQPAQVSEGFNQTAQANVIPSQESMGDAGMTSVMNSGDIGIGNAFDAFSNLSVSSAVQAAAEPATELATDSLSKDENSKAKYEEGEEVLYTKSPQEKVLVNVLTVHLDDKLVPFYTIKLPDGREKQTDNAHLSKFFESGEMREIKTMLVELDSNQIKKVAEFIKEMKQSEITLSTSKLTQGIEKPTQPMSIPEPAISIHETTPDLAMAAKSASIPSPSKVSTSTNGPMGMQPGMEVAPPVLAVDSNTPAGASETTTISTVPPPQPDQHHQVPLQYESLNQQGLPNHQQQAAQSSFPQPQYMQQSVPPQATPQAQQEVSNMQQPLQQHFIQQPASHQVMPQAQQAAPNMQPQTAQQQFMQQSAAPQMMPQAQQGTPHMQQQPAQAHIMQQPASPQVIPQMGASNLPQQQFIQPSVSQQPQGSVQGAPPSPQGNPFDMY